jgi:hypothetical protein
MDQSVNRRSTSSTVACAPSENIRSREISLAARRKVFVPANDTSTCRTLVLLVGDGKTASVRSIALRWDARARANDRVIRRVLGIGSSQDDIHALPLA